MQMLAQALLLSLLLGRMAGQDRGSDDLVQVVAGDPAAESAAEPVRRLASEAVYGLAPRFPGLRPTRFAVTVHSTAEGLPRAVRDQLHPETAGVALLGQQRIHLLLDAVALHPPNDLRTVVWHEVAHVLLDQFAGDAGPEVPRWLHEGLAQCASGGKYLGLSEEEIVFRAATDHLLLFSELEDSFPRGGPALRVAYAQSESFFAYLEREIGWDRILAAVRLCDTDRPFSATFRAATGRVLVYVERDWVEYLKSGSGAGLRVLLGSCFSLMLVAALPLLVLAASRRWRRDLAIRDRLETEEGDADPHLLDR